MDFVSHLMSGVAISVSLPDDPDPKLNFIKKSLPIVGSIFPDLPVTFIWQNIAKRIKKYSMSSIISLKLTKWDYDTYAGQASPWIQIYKIFHGLPFFVLVACVEMVWLHGLYASWGLLVHQLYDWPTHKFRSRNINPKPLYPLWDWTWRWGISCPWGFQWWFVLSWIAHAIIIFLVLN